MNFVQFLKESNSDVCLHLVCIIIPDKPRRSSLITLDAYNYKDIKDILHQQDGVNFFWYYCETYKVYKIETYLKSQYFIDKSNPLYNKCLAMDKSELLQLSYKMDEDPKLRRIKTNPRATVINSIERCILLDTDEVNDIFGDMLNEL